VKPVAGFFNRGLFESDHALLAGTHERAGTRRGQVHVARGPAATIAMRIAWKDKVRA